MFNRDVRRENLSKKFYIRKLNVEELQNVENVEKRAAMYSPRERVVNSL